jgi:hypothetical protein
MREAVSVGLRTRVWLACHPDKRLQTLGKAHSKVSENRS